MKPTANYKKNAEHDGKVKISFNVSIVEELHAKQERGIPSAAD
jgi:hypothetical protein